jgi:hypothetical protein
MEDNTIALTPECTIIYPALFEPESYGNAEPTYKAGFLIDKNEDISMLRNAVRAAAIKKWPSKSDNFYTQLNLPLRNGDSKAVDENGNPDKSNFYFGKVHFNAKSKWQPQIVNIYNDPITSDTEIYGGCVVRVYVSFYGYDYMGKLGIGTGLRAVCKIADGIPLGGGRIDTANVFSGVLKEKDNFVDNPPMDSKEYNEKGQQGQSGNRIIGADQDPWKGEPKQEPPKLDEVMSPNEYSDSDDSGIPF